MTGRLASILLCAALLAAMPAGFAAVLAQDQTAATTPAEEPPPLPRFRHADLGGKPASFTRASVIVLVDDDFAPFSYAGPEGEAKGIAVETVQAVCEQLHTKCNIVLTPWATLSGELSDSDGVVAGLRLDAKTLARFQPTRPIYRTIGRFVARKDSDLAQATPEALAGKRIGAVAGSGYDAWLKRNFAKAEIVAFPSLGELEDALRTGKVDFLFGDGLQLVYWTRGEASQACCKYIEGAYFDDELFSRPYVFLIRRGDEELKQAFDYALDQLQESGAYARIFGRYIPAPFW